MNPPQVNEYDYINFSIATQKAYRCVEAERVQPESADAAADNPITRLLQRLERSTTQLWQEAQPQVSLNQGILVVDDSRLDKFYAFEDGIGNTALAAKLSGGHLQKSWQAVWQPGTGSARHQLDYPAMDAGRSSHPMRLSVL